ncbi:MAG TPA: TIGR03560 family F420-dependent LLM class oxidoreductase [Thermoleophilaceae bacterium]|nr:TIGR03560 family F420-dependent LLM class oxidoreductase [Thermoleophilaceae bacterium]
MRVCLMIEGQEDVTWDQWRALASACEKHGYEGLFRSDHYLSVEGQRERGSLDAWTTLGALAAVTSRIRLGTLVSPATFRHPSVLAKSAATVDHISGGRVEIGLGAGWNESEHRAYGFPFASMRTRMDVMEEQLEIVARSFGDEAFSFDGEHYRIEELDALPKPVQRPRPAIVVGGRGGPRSLRLAARWADEYNTFSASVDEVRERRDAFAEAWRAAGRDPDAFRFSAMVSVLVGVDDADFRERAAVLAERRRQDVDSLISGLRGHGVVGTIDQAVAQLRELERAGIQRVMLQHFLHDDLESVELIGRELIPRAAEPAG